MFTLGEAMTNAGLVMALLMLGGWLMSAVGYHATFTNGLIFGLLGLMAALCLGKTAHERC